MSKKAKFKPEITKVKLNPEQAVLQCNCYNQGWTWHRMVPSDTGWTACFVTGERRTSFNPIFVPTAQQTGIS